MFFYLLCSCTVRKLAKKITLCLLSGKEIIPLQGQHVPQHDLHSLCHILRLSIDTFKHCRIDGVSRQSQKDSLFNYFFVFCRLGIDVRKTHSGMPGGDIYTSGSIYNRIPGDTLSDQHSMIRYGSLTQFLLFSNAFSSPQTQVRLCENPCLCVVWKATKAWVRSVQQVFFVRITKSPFFYFTRTNLNKFYMKSQKKKEKLVTIFVNY